MIYSISLNSRVGTAADALGLEPKTAAFPQHFGIEGWYSSSRLRRFLFCSGQPLNPESAADPVLTKLQELAELPPGWDYGEGRPTLPYVYQTARAFYQALAPFQLKADAFPCPDGSLYLVFYVGLRSVEIRIWADETIDLSVEEDMGKHVKELVSREDISEHEAKNQVIYLLLGQELFQWESSGSFIPDTTISNSLGFAVHSLPTQATELASRSSIPIVSVPTGTPLCQHIAQYYPPPIVGEPITYWEIPTDQLPGQTTIIATPSDTGDVCHRELKGLSNNQRIRFFKQQYRSEDVRVCQDGVPVAFRPDE